MNRVITVFFSIFLFSGCFYPGNKKISLYDGVYVGSYPDNSPLFVFTSWGEGYIIPDGVPQNSVTIDSLIQKEDNSIFLFETNGDYIETCFTLLSFDGKYAFATYNGDFRQSSYCFLSRRMYCGDNSDENAFVLKGLVRNYPTVNEQIKVFFRKAFKRNKHTSIAWQEVYNIIASKSEKETYEARPDIRYIQSRPKRTKFSDYATISIEEPVVFSSPLFSDERLLFDKGVLSFYKDDIFFDYRKNTYAFVLKGFDTMGEGLILFESSNGTLISYRPHMEFIMKPEKNELSSMSLAYVEPINRDYKDTVLHDRALFASLVSTLDEYFHYIDPKLFEKLERERRYYRSRGLLYE